MKKIQLSIGVVLLFIALSSFTIISSIEAQSVPEWIRNTALWYGEGTISETDFLNAMKFLIENDIIIIDNDIEPEPKTINVIIPNGNSDVGNVGFYIPLNAQIKTGTTVVWINDDDVLHTVQSQDEQGNVVGHFNSDVLNTGDSFEYTFNESGVYNYFCTLHPWRVGLVTVS